MTMLERMLIKGFQRHERLAVDFDPQITTIVGPTDAGKSSVIRALRWLATNRPRGDGFVREGSDSALVKLKVDGRTVKRYRGRTRNAYVVDGKELEAFGNDVPPQVSGLLNLSGGNFQGQHDSPFWFSLTPSEVARKLNAVVDLSAIDEVTEEVVARLRAVKAEVGVGVGRLAEAEAEVDRLYYVSELERDWDRLEGKRERSARRDARAASAEALAEGAVVIGERAKTLAIALAGALRALNLGADCGRARDKIDRAREIVIEVEGLRRMVGDGVPDLEGLEAKMTVAVGLSNMWSALRSLVGDIEDVEDVRQSGVKSMDDARKRLEIETGGVCPVCGGELR